MTPATGGHRIPHITAAGNAARSAVASGCDRAEVEVLGHFSRAEMQTLRRMLVAIIGDGEDRGSCL
jgi:hypothetical protein